MENCNTIVIVLMILSVIANFIQAFRISSLKKSTSVEIPGNKNRVSQQSHTGKGDNISSIN